MDLAKNKQNSLDMYDFIKGFVGKLFREDFMGSKPNHNSPFEDALATQVSSAIDLFIYIKDNTDTNNSLVAGILLRSLIEVAANIRFMTDNKNDSEMISKFLETSHQVASKLYDIKHTTPSRGIRWTNTSITKRISSIDNSDLNFLAAWHYFSSYSHSDAGYVGSYIHGQRENMSNIILGLSSIVFIEIGESLDDAGVLKDGFGKMFHDAAKIYLSREKRDNTNT